MTFLISSQRRDRAFDPATGRIAVFALAAGGFAASAVPAHALPPICYALDTPCYYLSPSFAVSAPRRVHIALPAVARPVLALAPRAAVTPRPVRVVVASEPETATKETTTSGDPADVTLDFVGADIGDVLRALALQTKTNIVTGTEVRGTITVSLAHVDMETALRLIATLSGYEVGRVGGTYVVGAPENVARLTETPKAADIKTETRILTCQFTGADALAAVKAAYPDLTATPGPAQNDDGEVLVVSGVAQDVQGAREVAAALEIAASRPPQILTAPTTTQFTTTTAQPGGGE